MEISFENYTKTEQEEQENNTEKPCSKITLDSLKKETKILDSGGNPVLLYNRSNTNFENFEIGKRNLPNKNGSNEFGFFFSSRNDLEHYGPFIKSRYLNIKNPWDIRDLGFRTEYKNFRAKLSELGISDKDMASFDLKFQDLYIERNKKLGLPNGLSKDGMSETRMATFNFFDAGNGYYLKKLLTDKGIDGVLFEDEGELTAIAFNPEQIIDPQKIEPNPQLN